MAVTILAFGPSIKDSHTIIGEAWSMNNCWDLFKDSPVMGKITRIFEMHQLSSRENMVCHSGRPYITEMDEWGRKGIRFTLLEKDERVTNSETFPLAAVEANVCGSAWCGNPAYALGMAIYEGHRHIRLIGVDLGDPKHSIQQPFMAYLIGVARGRGIVVDGRVFIDGHYDGKRYGYDFGPAWDEWQNRKLWQAFPMEVILKGEMDWRK
jgi:hypothetical protein